LIKPGELRNCGENAFKAFEMQRRIRLVSKYVTKGRSLPREKVVILGVPGGLSEVFGNIISSGSGIFYLPNVLNKLAYYMKYEPTVGFPLATALIESIFKCNFEEKELLVDHLMQNETRFLTLTLFGAPDCVAREEDVSTLSNDNRCALVFSDWLSAKCRQSDVVLAQTVQIKSISSLNVLMTETKWRWLYTSVIHVVRDPRAIIHDVSKSVAKQWTAEELVTTSYRICARMMLNLKTAESRPSWLKGRYYLIKIEDFFVTPEQHLQKLNEFFKKRSLDFGKSFGNLETLYASRKVNSWRTDMSLDDVQLVEKECAKVMALLGYETMSS
jgi:hypothetical protein